MDGWTDKFVEKIDGLLDGWMEFMDGWESWMDDVNDDLIVGFIRQDKKRQVYMR